MRHTTCAASTTASSWIFADAMGVVLADRYRTDEIFTLDRRDFRAVTPLTRGIDAFRILPADGANAL